EVAGGSVNHVACRPPDQQTQRDWQQVLLDACVSVTEVRARSDFTSHYFRAPGGVLLEIATDGPGFEYEEPLRDLGRRRPLPPWLEPRRDQIERALPELKVEE